MLLMLRPMNIRYATSLIHPALLPSTKEMAPVYDVIQIRLGLMVLSSKKTSRQSQGRIYDLPARPECMVNTI